MKRKEGRSHDPTNFTVEVFGDTWSLLILRDMMTIGKNTFGEFLKSEERIGPSVLADRLAHLERIGVITKNENSDDKRKTFYELTEAGLDTIPIIYEMTCWGSTASQRFPTFTRNWPHAKARASWLKAMKLDRDKVINAWREAIMSGSSFYEGPNSAAKKLGL